MERHVLHATSLLIRDYLMSKPNGATPSEVHRYVKEYKRKLGYKVPSYHSTFKYLYVLYQLGLVKRKSIRVGYKTKTLYYIVMEKATDPAWNHPQSTLYPATRLGSRRYSKLKAQGIEPRGRGV
jgi:hypothetical protein